MDEDMHRVEINLSDVSRKCNSRVIDNIARNYGDFVHRWKSPGIFPIVMKRIVWLDN